MPKVNTVEKARKDDPDHGIKAGDKYYWWKFRFGGIHKSKTYPKRSQLTQSSFLSWLYDLEDTISSYEGSTKEDFEAHRDELASEIESQHDELQSNLENMPEGLQESSILNERIEALDSWKSDVENCECEDYDEEELAKEIREEEKLGEDEDVSEKVNAKIQELVEAAYETLKEQGAGL